MYHIDIANVSGNHITQHDTLKRERFVGKPKISTTIKTDEF